MSSSKSPDSGSNFLRTIIEADLESGKHSTVITRFPPEPNGYPHIGHAKSICLNFGLARDFGGRCHLRMDDTNPSTEDMEYVEALKNDVQWLGFDWGEHLYFASDYFEQLYEFAVGLIKSGKAYVCSLSEEETRAMRGSVSEPGTPSPYRSRTVAENLQLFAEMRDGKHPEGAHVLRAKIDMANSNMKMRDPLLYRIRHEHHYRRENEWCIYPMYDFAHCLSDSLEGITHSICTLEFENNRELYDWIIDNCDTHAKPKQYEFARLNLNYSVMSKRKLLRLVKDGYVSGWDDPRMFTLSGLRRRGYTPASIREFADRIGVAKANSTVDVGILEYCIRDDLGDKAPRVMAVLDPLKVVIENYPEDQVEHLEAPFWPPDHPSEETRPLPFSREIYIEREDFMEEPSKKFFRLAPGREVRLRHAYVIRCDKVIKDNDGRVVELRCSYDPDTKSGESSGGRRVKGTLHWVSVAHAHQAEVRLYDRLFSSENPDGEDGDFVDYLNPMSLEVRQVPVEPGLADCTSGHVQFERQGYFFVDPVDSKAGSPVFNRVVSLKDSWAKATKSRSVAPQKPATAAPGREGASKESVWAERLAADPQMAAHHAELIADSVASEEAAALASDSQLVAFYRDARGQVSEGSLLAKWIVNELSGVLKQMALTDLKFDAKDFGALVAMIESKRISGKIAKTVLSAMVAGEGSAESIVATRGLEQISDPELLGGVISEILASHEDQVRQVLEGNERMKGFFVGQVMKRTGGKANPGVVNALLQDQLESLVQ